MTEHEWLTSDDPAAMWQHVRDRATPAQHDAFRLALLDKSCWEPPKFSLSIRAAILRDIFGNPFRPITWDGDVAFQVTCNEPGKDCREPRIFLRPAWLSWNDGAVPKLAASIAGGQKCEMCSEGCPLCGGPEAEYHTACCVCQPCHGTGRTPPRFEDMPILADALEQASDGRAPRELIVHLRGMERCPNSASLAMDDCPLCKDTGWMPLRGPHVQSCWALTLLGGQP